MRIGVEVEVRVSVEQLQVSDGDLSFLGSSLSHQPVCVHTRNTAHSDHLRNHTHKHTHGYYKDINSSSFFCLLHFMFLTFTALFVEDRTVDKVGN